jgi:hypothetical protein
MGIRLVKRSDRSPDGTYACGYGGAVTDEPGTPPLDSQTRASLIEGLEPLPHLVLAQMSTEQGMTTSRLARVICQQEWAVQPVIEDLHRLGLVERGEGGWRLTPDPTEAAHAEDMLARIRVLAADTESPDYRVSGDIYDVLREQVTEHRRAVIESFETRHISGGLETLTRYLSEASLIVWPAGGTVSDQKLYGLIHNAIGRAAGIANSRRFVAERRAEAGEDVAPTPRTATEQMLNQVRAAALAHGGRPSERLAAVREVLGIALPDEPTETAPGDTEPADTDHTTETGPQA